MNNIAVFSGQSINVEGLGENFFEKNSFIDEKYKEIEKISGVPIKKLIKKNLSSEEQKQRDKYIQLIILAYQVSIFDYFQKVKNMEFNYFAGHSLGEYSALICSNKLDLKDGVNIVKKRTELMYNSALKVKTGMLSIRTDNTEKIESILKSNKDLYVSCYNSKDDIVLSGKIKELDSFLEENSNSDFIKGSKFLTVNGAFHSPFMQPAADGLLEMLLNVNFHKNNNTVYSCYSGEAHYLFNVRDNLYKQIYMPVEWENILEDISNVKNLNIYDIGPQAMMKKFVLENNEVDEYVNVKKIEDLLEVE